MLRAQLAIPRSSDLKNVPSIIKKNNEKLHGNSKHAIHYRDALFVQGEVLERSGRKSKSALKWRNSGSIRSGRFRKKKIHVQPLRSKIGSFLQQKRKAAGMTQLDVSEKTGITIYEISRIENGSRNATLDTIERITNAIGVELNF